MRKSCHTRFRPELLKAYRIADDFKTLGKFKFQLSFPDQEPGLIKRKQWEKRLKTNKDTAICMTSGRPVKFLARSCWTWKLIWTPSETGDPAQVSKEAKLKKVKCWKSTEGKYHIYLLSSSPNICFSPHVKERILGQMGSWSEPERAFCKFYVMLWEARDQFKSFTFCQLISFLLDWLSIWTHHL